MIIDPLKDVQILYVDDDKGVRPMYYVANARRVPHGRWIPVRRLNVRAASQHGDQEQIAEIKKRYVDLYEIVIRCKTIKTLAENEIRVWQHQPPEYRKTHNIERVFQTKQDMEDVLIWLSHIRTFSSEDMRPVLRAKWIMPNADRTDRPMPECSNCGWYVDFGGVKDFNHCPNCGAEIRKGNEHGKSE